MGIRQKLFGLDNQTTQSSKSFEVWQEADGSIQAYQNGNALVAGEVNSTGGIKNISSGGVIYSGPKKTYQPAYILATYGDSRANVNSTGPDVSGTTQSLSVTKGPSWTAAYRKDTELRWNYGVSGDTAAGWNATARTGSKTAASFAACGADLVHIQYGVNDIITGNGTTPTADTICGYLKSVVMEGLKSGMAVVLESVLPCTSAGWTSGGSGTAAQKQAIADAVNTTMAAWIQNVAMAAFADTATFVKAADGYANSGYYVDSIHLNNRGAALSGKTVANASLSVLPHRVGVFYTSGLTAGPNFVDMLSAPITTILSGFAGTFTLNSQTTGVDPDAGPYVEFNITANTLTSGEATFWAAIGGDVGGFGATNKYSVAASDVLQGACRLVVDNGSGLPVAGLRNIVVRQRCYYQAGGGIYADWGSYATPSGQNDMSEAFDLMFVTPRMTTTTASAGIEPPTHVKGYGLHLYVSVSQTASPVRIRVYAPMLRKAA